MHQGSTTIVALSSGSLPSGVAVVRLSGPACRAIAGDLIGSLPPPRHLTHRTIRGRDGVLDQGLVAYFEAPHSFTGEDCLEFQVHGSPAVVRALLQELTDRPGVVFAEAGEFTRRAFDNGKLDLTAIEGLGDLLTAETETQRAQAQARMSGDLRRLVERWVDALLDARAEFEAQLDFSDEGDVAAGVPLSTIASLEAVGSEIAAELMRLDSGRIVRDGLRVALAGPPNAGKSSLINALSRSDVAIVTAEPGTTRDVREVALNLNGRLVVLVDMAGLRESDSLAEAEGVRRAKAELAKADLVLWLVAPDTSNPPAPGGERVWAIRTKADLGPQPQTEGRSVSAKTGAGIAALLDEVATLTEELAGGGALVSHERDRVALVACAEAIGQALNAREAELAAEALRAATTSLERFIGRVDAEAVLDRLFLSFCIGK